MRRHTMLHLSMLLPLAFGGCIQNFELGDGGSSSGDDATSGPGATSTTGNPDTNTSTSASSATTGDAQTPGCTLESPCKLDILVVMDNSADTADVQIGVVHSLVELVAGLQHHEPGVEVPVDVQMMFTSTDLSGDLCWPFEPGTYTPAMGGPVASGCNERIADFTHLGPNPTVREDACTGLCPFDVVPSDPFLAFYGEDSNVPDVSAVDVDGDGDLDSPAAQAAACLAPQGLVGCGYEAPLAAMARALDPSAAWNNGVRPFLREGSAVTVILVSPETECSLDDQEALTDPQYQQINPQTGMLQVSSAACWNAGMDCPDPEDGSCEIASEPLAPLERYQQLLAGGLREIEGREISMVAITGVPPITGRSETPPYVPDEGGLEDIHLRGWIDGTYPAGDVFPSEAAAGVDVADLEFEYGIGPACARVDEGSGAEVRALPSPRMITACRDVNRQAGFTGDIGERCCIESVCDPRPSLACVEGWITQDWTLDD
ncbi:MAG: hypothetical protein K1X88_22410 [Nannocystaceae bacterium]|nr:hypothetical protein [Nannocystaceae bacterium]